MFEIALIIITIIFCLFLYVLYPTKSTIPGPWGLPIIGYLHKLDVEAPYLTLSKLAQKYGPIYKINLGIQKTVVISEAKLLRKILLKDESLGRPRLILLDTMFKRKGVVYSEGDSWKELRKLLVSFLRTVGAGKSSPNKKNLDDKINKSAEEFVKSIKLRGNRVIVNALEEVEKYVSRIGSVLFLGKSSKNDEMFNTLIQDVHEITHLSAIGGPINFLPFLRFLPNYSNILRSVKKLYCNIHRLQKIVIHETVKSESNTEENIIHAFLNQKSKQHSEEIYNSEQLEFLSFDTYAATMETSVMTIVWTIKYLAIYPEVQNKVRQEIFDVFKEKGPQFDDSNLPYTKATLSEAARIRTVAPLALPHSALDDITIDNFIIRKGTMIMPLLWNIHMDPKIWEKPEEFRPERFLDSDGNFCSNDAFMPFLIGRRICPGENLSKMLIFLFFATVLQQFKFENCNSCPDFSGVCGITLVPKEKEVVFEQI